MTSCARDAVTSPTPLVGHTILGIGLLADAYATALLLQTWELYEHPWASAALLAVAALLPLAVATAARRWDSRLPRWLAFLFVAAGFAISVAVPMLLPSEHRMDAAWNWGNIGMTLLGLAAMMPVEWSIMLGLAHAGLAVVVLQISGLSWWSTEVAAMAAALPVLAAARYVGDYADALGQLTLAIQARASADERRHQLIDLGMAENRRLRALRDESTTLLEAVSRETGPVTAENAATARRLASRLRAALQEQRRCLWLPQDIGGTVVQVVVSDDLDVDGADPERTWISAIVRLLGHESGWRDIRVVLGSDGSAVGVVITAEGPGSAKLAGDGRLRELCSERGAEIELDGDRLTVDATTEVDPSAQ